METTPMTEIETTISTPETADAKHGEARMIAVMHQVVGLRQPELGK
jgi:hypothetical protein